MALTTTINGTVRFLRDSPKDQVEECRDKCGPGGHIRKRRILLDGNFHATFDETIERWLERRNEVDGRRVRITVEVLDPLAPPPAVTVITAEEPDHVAA